MSSGSPEQLIYDEALRVIGRHQALAAELRGSASLLIATAAIAISLLDEAAFDGACAGAAWLALAAFLVVCGCAMVVLWPASKVPDGPEIELLVRSLTVRSLRRERAEASDLLCLLTANLADHQHLISRRNAIVASVFRIGTIALLVQVVASVATRILTS